MCISILHTPGDDPLGYETAAERWSPVQSIEKILLSVVSMMAEPNDESGANVDACVSGLRAPSLFPFLPPPPPPFHPSLPSSLPPSSLPSSLSAEDVER